jgi:DNA transformation protein
MGRKGTKLTPVATQTAELLEEKLAPLGDVTSRKMFGGYGIFKSGSMFALVTSEGVAHLKVDESNLAKFEKAESKQHGRMPYYEIPVSVLKNTRSLRSWATASLAVAKK